MYINDDADAAEITKQTIAAANECARMIGKIGPQFTGQQVLDMAAAVERLQSVIKGRLANAPRS
jgi:hypothetical protein